MELLVGNPVHVYTLLDRLVRGLPGLLAGVSSQLGERINLTAPLKLRKSNRHT